MTPIKSSLKKSYKDICSLVVGVIPLLPDLIRQTPLDVKDYLLSLTLFLATNAALSIVERMTEPSLLEKIEEQTQERIAAHEMVTYLDKGDAASKKFISLIGDILEAQNVYVSSYPNSHIVGYSSERVMVQAYKEAFGRKDVKWTDVIGGNLQGYYARFKDQKKSDIKANFKCFELSSALPLVNFVIFKLRSTGEVYVYFGWGLHQTSHNAEVFVSKHEKVINYFRNLHDAMVDASTIVDVDVLIQRSNPTAPAQKPKSSGTASPG